MGSGSDGSPVPAPSRHSTGSAADADNVSYVGVNIGALTVKLVVLRNGRLHPAVVSHRGRPLQELDRLLAEQAPAGRRFIGVSGHLGHISEIAAVERALVEIEGGFDAVASLGGETFLVFILTGNRVLSVVSHNKCAAGSGEFFMQQIGRMEIGLDEAIQRSFQGQVVPLASRCSVHCKSDITHKLNRREASGQDILHSLHAGMADKVVSLLDKGQRPLIRVLLIGGVSRNRAMVAALRAKRPGTEFVVLPQSPFLEAWGTALLTRDDPLHTSPRISVKPTLTRLPPLSRYGDRVRAMNPPVRPSAGRKPLVLGVDAGSTTTKAVLLDAETRAVVASHYGRTRGDPVDATKRCLRALAEQVGNRPVGLIATTGSAREITGAYLGTEHAYNEISAQATGSAHFDPEVDTIFEIGGQDSKYIYLRNGVPVDYAMNAACSAGTGSFLEESALGDLGITVAEIASIALAARSPVRLKATCAAFINSDIRMALQEGFSREDVVAGLVYSIANNYLTKVKGPRFVGQRVLLQGGLALNRAVAHAFAHSVRRDVVIPPHPELLGAQGVALLALERSRGVRPAIADLTSLAEPQLRRLGQFTCRACELFCTVENFAVAGRRFPFGGRCTLFENVWKRKARGRIAADLGEARARLIFSSAATDGDPPGPRVGIPRALTAHSLYPFYSTFLSQLGLNVVLSGVEPAGELRTHAGFCFPAQIAHGAVLDLAQRRVPLVFVPHVVRMPNPIGSRDSYLCPITQAGPYVLSKAFPETRFLTPELDFTGGYHRCTALVEMAVRELGAPPERAERALRSAVAAQLKAEESLRDLGCQALNRVLEKREPAIVLVGRSYNAFTPEASQSVGRKLSSMGVTVIPADCLAPLQSGSTSWHFPNMILNAVEHVKRHANLFLLYVSNFSCTIDSFTQSRLSSELDSKPYLILEIDAHTADGGIQTRLEAFLDIVHNYRHGTRTRSSSSFTPAGLKASGMVATSSGEELSLSNPRVNLYFPAFSAYHSQAWSMAARWLGLHPGRDLRLERGQLDRGLRHTSGRECLPLPICAGQLCQIAENRKTDEISGFLMLRGGAPCVVDCFMGYLERFVAQNKLRDLFLCAPHKENDYLGIGPDRLASHLSPPLNVADILVEIEQALRVVGGPGTVEQLKRDWQELIASATSLDRFEAGLPELIDRLARIPRSQDPAGCPRVVVTGDFFTRFNELFMEGVPELYAAQGIILKPVDLDDIVLYTIYSGIAGTAQRWGLEPGSRAALKACTRFLQPDGQAYLARWAAYQWALWREKSYRRRFWRTGLLVAGPNDVSHLFREASKHLSPTIFGEAITTVGKGLEAGREGYDGVIVIGPFNCLPFRISEAILKPVCYQRGTPILTYESDGYSVAPAFLRQVEVHIQQVLAHWKESRSTGSAVIQRILRAARSGQTAQDA